MRSIIGEIIKHEAEIMQISLSIYEINSFETFAVELLKWNRKFNLTAITKENEIAIKHFIDSLSLAPYISADDRLLDIGSGAGLPIIPLKIIRPDIPMVSVDAVAKKINFQRHVIRILNLQLIEAIHGRFEELHNIPRHSFSVITSRAFANLDRFVVLAAPFLTENGLLIAMKGDRAEEEIAASEEAIYACGFEVASIHHYTLSGNMGKRALIFLKRSKAF